MKVSELMEAVYAAIRVLLLQLSVHIKKKEEDNTPFLEIADKSDNKKLHGYSFAERSAGKEAVGQLIIIDLGSYFLMSLMHTVSSLL